MMQIINILFSMLTFYKRFKKKKCEEVVCYEEDERDRRYTREELVNIMDYSIVPEPIVINKVETGKNILIVDDIDYSISLYQADSNVMLRKYGKSFFKENTIIFAGSNAAGFIAHKYIMDPNNKIDIAILDITLGSRYYIQGYGDLEYDGIDIVIELLKINPDLKFVLSTAHSLDRANKTLQGYYTKFETATGLILDDYYVAKNNDRHDDLYKLVYNGEILPDGTVYKEEVKTEKPIKKSRVSKKTCPNKSITESQGG